VIIELIIAKKRVSDKYFFDFFCRFLRGFFVENYRRAISAPKKGHKGAICGKIPADLVDIVAILKYNKDEFTVREILRWK
jgi:hypothetical protein